MVGCDLDEPACVARVLAKRVVFPSLSSKVHRIADASVRLAAVLGRGACCPSVGHEGESFIKQIAPLVGVHKAAGKHGQRSANCDLQCILFFVCCRVRESSFYHQVSGYLALSFQHHG